MRRFARVAGLCVVLLPVWSCSASSTPQTPDADVRAIGQLISDYAKAATNADTAMAARVWDTSEAVTFIHPLGHERGWSAVKKNVYETLMGGMFSTRDLQIEQPAIHVAGDSAWSEFDWVFHATLKDTGKTVVTRGRETQIYRRQNGQWRIEHVHYSSAPE